MNVTLPNGRIIKGVPEGTSKEEIKDRAIKAGIAKEADFAPREPTLSEKALGVGEAALSVVSGALAEPMSGLYGISEALDPFESEGAGARGVEAAKETLTYQPKSDFAKSLLGSVGEKLQPVIGGLERLERDLGEGTLELTGSDELATIAHSLPTVMLEAIGFAGGKSAINASRVNRKLMDGVKPAKKLVDALEAKGVVVENLDPQVIKRIPSNLPALVRKGKSIDRIADDIMGAQINLGAGDANLAKYKAIKDKSGLFRLEGDKIAKEAIKQGYDEGFVQSMKTASSDTKAKMRQMNTNMKRIKSDEKLASDLRPSNVVGDAVTDRIKIIRDTANNARDELSDIAKNRLEGKRVNARPVAEQFRKSLDDLGVEYYATDSGLEFDFTDSIIQADPGSQRLINKSFELMNKNKPADALMLHNFKKQLDALIDFNKVSKGGLPESGRNVLKSLRAEANKAIRSVDADYARVNDVLSESLEALDEFQTLVGKRMPIYKDSAFKSIGQDMRALLSNQKRRVVLDDSLKAIDGLAKKYGYKGNDDIEQLVRMANRLDRRFGAVAETSFQGNIESALESMVRQVSTGDVQGVAANAAAGAVMGTINKFRKVDDLHAFKAVDELLKRAN